MKSSTHHTLSDRRALFAATIAVLLGAATAVAQTTTSSGTRSSTDSTRSNPDTYGTGTSSSSSRDTGTTSATGSSQTDTTRSSGAYDTSGTRSSTSSATDSRGGATTMTGRQTAGSGKLGWMERRFVHKAADHGKSELALAELATQQASNAEVKSFAQKLIDDHSKVDQELTSLAGEKNVKLDDDDAKDDRHYKRLAKKSGMEFDQEFVEMMVDMHEDDVKMFEKASTDAKDPALKSFAAKHVDHLRQHLQQAQSLRSTIMPTGRMEASSSTTSGTSSTGSSTSTTDSTSSSPQPGSTSGTGTTGTGTTGSSSTDTTPPRSNR